MTNHKKEIPMQVDETVKPADSSSTRPRQIQRIIALFFVIVLTALLIIFRDKVQNLGAYGYPGIFLVSMLTNATLILPLPGVILTSAMGAVFNPFGVALAAGTGAALGEISGYVAGYSGQGVAQRTKIYAKLEGWIRKYGDAAVFLLALIPNPAFDMGGMIAGVLRMPLWRFLLWCWLGKVLKMLAFAYAGSIGINFIPGMK
jgi:uncharacterized membrane protein YdjX (TVP38/TMEM64 family)